MDMKDEANRERGRRLRSLRDLAEADAALAAQRAPYDPGASLDAEETPRYRDWQPPAMPTVAEVMARECWTLEEYDGGCSAWRRGCWTLTRTDGQAPREWWQPCHLEHDAASAWQDHRTMLEAVIAASRYPRVKLP